MTFDPGGLFNIGILCCCRRRTGSCDEDNPCPLTEWKRKVCSFANAREKRSSRRLQRSAFKFSTVLYRCECQEHGHYLSLLFAGFARPPRSRPSNAAPDPNVDVAVLAGSLTELKMLKI